MSASTALECHEALSMKVLRGGLGIYHNCSADITIVRFTRISDSKFIQTTNIYVVRDKLGPGHVDTATGKNNCHGMYQELRTSLARIPPKYFLRAIQHLIIGKKLIFMFNVHSMGLPNNITPRLNAEKQRSAGLENPHIAPGLRPQTKV